MDTVHFHGCGVWGTAQNLVQAYIHLYPLPPKLTLIMVAGKEDNMQDCREYVENFIKQKREVWLMYGFGMWILWLAFNRSEVWASGHWGCVLASQAVEPVWKPLGTMELCLARLGATGAVWGLGPENQGCGSQGWAAEPQRSVWPSLWFHGFSPSVPGFVYEVWGRMALPFQLLAAQSGRIFKVKGTGLKSCLIFHPQWGLAIHKWQPQRGREKHHTLCSLILAGNMGLFFPPHTCKPTRKMTLLPSKGWVLWEKEQPRTERERSLHCEQAS